MAHPSHWIVSCFVPTTFAGVSWKGPDYNQVFMIIIKTHLRLYTVHQAACNKGACKQDSMKEIELTEGHRTFFRKLEAWVVVVRHVNNYV